MTAPVDEPVFAAPWEAQAFALVVALHRRGAFDWNDWAAALARSIAESPEAPYYDRWLAALEALVTERGLAGADELARFRDAWRHAAERTPHGQPITLEAGDFPSG